MNATITPARIGYTLLALGTIWLGWAYATGATDNPSALFSIVIASAALGIALGKRAARK